MTTPFQLIRCLHRPFAVYMRINRFKHHSISFVVGSCRPIYHSISFVVGSCRPIYLSISFVVVSVSFQTSHHASRALCSRACPKYHSISCLVPHLSLPPISPLPLFLLSFSSLSLSLPLYRSTSLYLPRLLTLA